MAANQILLLRVGMDLGFGGLGPLFADGRFEYVPIPENTTKTSSCSLYFSEISALGRHARSVRAAATSGRPCPLRPGIRHVYLRRPNSKQARTIAAPAQRHSGFLRWLCAGPSNGGGSRLYVIGYFTVQTVHDVRTLGPWPPHTLRHLWANAHFRRRKPDVGLVVVEGSHPNSRLLRSAVPLSDDRQLVLPEMQRRLGLTGSVMRAGAGRWVPATHVAGVERWLRSLEVPKRLAASTRKGTDACLGKTHGRRE